MTQQRHRAALVHPRPVDQPPASRLQVDRKVNEQTRRTANQAGTGTACGELREVRELRELIEHKSRRDYRVGARQ
jgi:hypothetical protein